MRFERYLCLLVVFCFSTVAQASGRKASSPFERRLKSKGWTLTSKSIAAKPGDIYNRSAKTVFARRKECFTADVSKREVASSLQMKETKAEISGLFGMIRAGAKGSKFEGKAYLDPYRSWIPSSNLEFKPDCLDKIRRSPDRGDLVVVTDIVSAQYKTVTRKTRKAVMSASRPEKTTAVRPFQRNMSPLPISVAP